jgi:hypothetical protein
MISFPLSLALIPYGLVVIFFAVMAIINVYHLVHYGATTGVSYVVTFLFLAGGVFILFFTWWALQGTDWGRDVGLIMPFAGGFDPPDFTQP